MGAIIGAVLNVLAKVFGPLLIYFSGRKAGATGVERDQARDAVAKGTERNRIDADVAALPDADLDDELRDGGR